MALPPESVKASSPSITGPHKHLSVGSDGDTYVDITFTEEPLGLSAEDGYGFADLQFEQVLHSRYRVVRKLGFGRNSSTWLAIDERTSAYVALKVLTGRATELYRLGRTWELQALQVVSKTPSVGQRFCLQLLDHFQYVGPEEEGEHQCLVTEVMGGDLRTLQSALLPTAGETFPLPLVKRILQHILMGLSHIHLCGVVHTDLKHDNILFTSGASTRADLDRVLGDEVPQRHPPEESLHRMIQPAISQPLPPPSLTEAAERTFVLGDFGSAQDLADRKTDEITPDALRPPEIMLGGPWNEKVDMWTFGCLVFEVSLNKELFKHEPFDEYKLDADEAHLWQMMGFTGLTFEPDQLQQSRYAAKYFDQFCNLRKKPPRFNQPIEGIMRKYEVLDEADVVSVNRIVRNCLRLNPDERPSATILVLLL